jgi:AcrR family transcriptional regulator
VIRVTAASIDAPQQRRRPGRPKGSQVVADREQLLAAALDVIRNDGPDVTMDDIAAAANVSKPILYRTIGDKDALVAALSESFVDRLDEAVLQSFDRRNGPRAAFEAAMQACLRTVDTDRNLFLFVNTGGQGTDSFRHLVERSARQMHDRFTAARTASGLDPAPSRTWSYAMVGAIQVVAMMWLDDQYADLDDVAAHLTQLMWPGFVDAGSA